jgi:hypothetical protein
MQQQTTTVEACSPRWRRAHGVVTRGQLLRAGITAEEIRQRMRNGSLQREHPGVYRVGHPARSVQATFLAAVWACGDGAVPSGRAAAHLWGLIEGRAPRPEVTAPTKRRVQGVVTRRGKDIEATTHRGIPITTVPRTLVDLAAHLPLDALARACHEAGVKYETTPRQVEAVLAKRARVKRRQEGCAWEQDRRREREARARGDEFRRYTYGDVVETPRLMLAERGALLR